MRVGPAIVRAAHEEPLAPGAAVAVVLRAESARLARPPVDPAGNALPGTIAYTVYLGTSAEYEVRLAAGPAVRVVEQIASGTPSFRDGEAVAVTWAPEDAIVLPGSGDALAGIVP